MRRRHPNPPSARRAWRRLAAAVALAPATAFGQAPVTDLDAVVSSAMRYERSLKDIPATITTIESDDMEKRNVSTIRDLTRYEPGVTTTNNPLRTGLGSFTIRGVGGNRVAVRIDGLRVPDYPENSQPGTYFRNYVDLENIKRVEIVRGPASVLFGSDAIGGLVSYVTKDPSDYLAMVGKDWYVSGRAGYDSADSGYGATATVAARADAFEMLGLITRREGHELQNNGSIPPNPQNTDLWSGLGKLVWNAGDFDRFRLVFEYQDANTYTDVLSSLTATIRGQETNDNTIRRRFSLDQVHDAPIGFIDNIRWLIGYQEVDRTEQTKENRFAAGTPRLRTTDQAFIQDIWTVDVQAETKRDIAELPNRIIYGFDASIANSTRPRDRQECNLVTLVCIKTIAGENFPTKTFPDSQTLYSGAYVQDEIIALGGALSIVGGLRLDYYSMTVSPDADFLRNNPPGAVGDTSAISLSPKLGGVYRLDPVYSLYGNYAHGFRAPPYDDAGIGFTNAAFGYRVLPNPDLQPETSDGVELGLRGAWPDGSSFQAVAFYTLYRNFIEQVSLGIGPTGLLDFQAQNLDRVTIWGGEAKGRWQFLPNWALAGAVAYAYGVDDSTGLPIDSVDPLTGYGALRYEQTADLSGWGGEFAGRAALRHTRVSDPSFFEAPGYGVFDMLGFYNWGTNVSVNAGVFNIFNKTYYQTQDVIGLPANSPLKPLYTQPGTTFAVNLTVRW